MTPLVLLFRNNRGWLDQLECFEPFFYLNHLSTMFRAW